MSREGIEKFLRHPTTHKVAIGILAFGGGLIVGYVLGRGTDGPPPDDPSRKELDEIAKEVEELRAKRLAKQAATFDEEEHRRIAAEGEPPGAETVTRYDDDVRVVKIIDESGPLEPIITRNVFAEANVDDDWDLDVETRNRDSTTPYVLHRDEFYLDEMGFTQHTYTYYAGDDILVTEEDQPVYNHDQVVGELKFGHGSGDAKVVYIRNENRKEEYEIIREPGLFSREVLGLEIESNDRTRGIEHSAPRKFRPPQE